MADSSHIRKFIQSWEGGLSKATTDKASSNPAPWALNGVTGYHTNKGVTYTTFVSLAPKLGYQISAENFFTMPDKIWNGIFKIGYWDVWGLDKMKSQAIADLIADFAWASGAGGTLRSIKKYLIFKGVQVDSMAEAVTELNRLSAFEEEKIFLELIDWRKNFFISLNQPANLKGWLNRLLNGSGSKQSIYQFGITTIKKKRFIRLAIIVVAVVLIAGITIYLIKKRK